MDEKLLNIQSQIENEQPQSELDEQDRVVVNLKVKSDEGFLSPYSIKGADDISMEVADFIDRNVEGVGIKDKLHVRIFSNTITDEEKTVYEKAIRFHYKQAYIKTNKDVKKHNKLALIFASIAVFVLIGIIVLESLGLLNAITSEIADITAWVFMWEAIYILFLQRPADKIKEIRYLKVVESVIEFLPLDE